MEVRPRYADPRRRRAADPVVGDAARVEALDELVLVDAPADAGDLEPPALLDVTAGTLTLSSSPCEARARGCSGDAAAARAASAKSACSQYSCEIAKAGQLLITASIAAETVPEYVMSSPRFAP